MKRLKYTVIRLIAKALSIRCCPPEPRFSRVVFKVDRIGDFFLGLGALHALLDDAVGETALVVSHDVETLACMEFPNTQVIGVRYKTGGFFPDVLRMLLQRSLYASSTIELVCLRHQRIDFHNLALRAIRCRKSYGYEFSRGSGLPSAAPYPFTQRAVTGITTPTGLCHELTRHEQVLRLLGMPSPSLPVARYLQKGSAGPSIVVAPLGGNPIRDIPATQLKQVVDAVCQRTTATMALCCAPAQRGRLVQLATEAGVEAPIQSQLPLEQYVSWVAHSALVVSADSATAHMASVFDRAFVGLIAGGHDREFVPWSRSARQHWLTHRLDCFNCDWRCPYPVARCLSGIAPDRLAAAVENALRDSGLEMMRC